MNTGTALGSWTWMLPLSPAAQQYHSSQQAHLRAIRSARAKQIYRVSTSRKTEEKTEDLLACFMRCSTIMPERSREKRQVQGVVNQIVSGWKLMQTRSIIIVQDFCNAQESDEKTVKCLVNDCQKGHKDNKLLQKVIDSMQALQNVTSEICPNKDSKKLRCLVNSKSAISDITSGLKCNEAAENFRNEGVSRKSNKMVISGQSLCELFYCPAEAAKDYSENSCKDFVYDVVSKIGDLNYYSFAFGFEEAKNVLKSMFNGSTGGIHTGEKCTDLVSN
uniref:Uncharacterized protein n=1 Tax=Acrobeloides nanus TaxID=290746 RepID=A0A914E569_9BILA